MLDPPEDVAEDALVAALSREWGVAVAAITYRPVGFGSHHWAVTDRAGAQWFATVDDLDRKRLSAGDSCDAAYRRLRGALDAARGLRRRGAGFVVAPLTTAGDHLVARLDGRYAMALYPFVTGDSFGFGEYAGDDHRHAVLDMIAEVHRAPAEVRDLAPGDTGGVPHRDELEAALSGREAGDCGPYAGPAAELFVTRAAPVRDLLARYDTLMAAVDPGRAVLTHGEPHPGNTMRTADGWRLVDWDTTLVAQPERDLWMLGAGVHRAYAAATGVEPLPELLEMHGHRWDLSDLAVEAYHFRHPHTGDANDAESWTILQRLVARIAGR